MIPLPHELFHPWHLIGEEFFCGNFSMFLHSKITKVLLFLNTLSACWLFPDPTDSSKLPASHVWHSTSEIFFVISVSFFNSSDLSYCIFPCKMLVFMSLSTFLLCQAPATRKNAFLLLACFTCHSATSVSLHFFFLLGWFGAFCLFSQMGGYFT